MKFFLSGYAFRDGQNLHVHTLSLNLHTVPNQKRVLKTELGTQKNLPPEMTLYCYMGQVAPRFGMSGPLEE